MSRGRHARRAGVRVRWGRVLVVVAAVEFAVAFGVALAGQQDEGRAYADTIMFVGGVSDRTFDWDGAAARMEAVRNFETRAARAEREAREAAGAAERERAAAEDARRAEEAAAAEAARAAEEASAASVAEEAWYGEEWDTLLPEPAAVAGGSDGFVADVADAWENMDGDASWFRRMGRVSDGNYEFTWYSEKVLPGGGLTELNANGRHTDSDGYVRDGDGYIAVASSDLERGAVVDTPFGEAKVYDSGCPSGVIDVYTNWG